ncbi:pilus assembly protein TadG-related protein [Kitasatospora arboriphila]|uniref:Putative Flp pilus-assembly TadG-like N-terminal domain-containing protein n=1 Tax=Kitasatospora arboriphila TaxID=258052 RepID=A0ABN1U6P1_9ACTN
MTTTPAAHRGTDRGSITAFAAVTVLGLLAFLGLVTDGGLVLAARVHASGQAEEAARDGARRIDLGPLRRGGPARLRPAEAQSAAQYYLRAAGADGDATATADTVTVTVRRTQPMQLLTLVGISSLTVTATASAHPVETGRA